MPNIFPKMIKRHKSTGVPKTEADEKHPDRRKFGLNVFFTW